jgi:hypothetical protein
MKARASKLWRRLGRVVMILAWRQNSSAAKRHVI